MRNQWDERYNRSEYIYGTEPNLFLKDFIEKNKPGRLLLPGDGEGRNSVYAAKSGWQVTAFDSSKVAKTKALKLARQMNVSIQYDVCSVMNFDTEHKFDLISLIYLHLEPNIRKSFHKKLVEHLNEEGHILLEVFSKEQIYHSTGGPKNPDMLYSIDELKDDFDGMNIKFLEKTTTYLSEGTHHNGQANVIRLLASKN
ncbi:MAG TPA: class I SAM-dependent methyltransferase [Bacteroidales bacterium]|nr:class I SAM-dependent methyltransferase [Bacteroidales bacterium]